MKYRRETQNKHRDQEIFPIPNTSSDSAKPYVSYRMLHFLCCYSLQ